MLWNSCAKFHFLRRVSRRLSHAWLILNEHDDRARQHASMVTVAWLLCWLKTATETQMLHY